MANTTSESFPKDRRIAASDIFATPLSEEQHNELRRLAAIPEAHIDYSDSPEAFPEAVAIQRGRFYRPIKQLVSLRVDAEVVRIRPAMSTTDDYDDA